MIGDEGKKDTQKIEGHGEDEWSGRESGVGRYRRKINGQKKEGGTRTVNKWLQAGWRKEERTESKKRGAEGRKRVR